MKEIELKFKITNPYPASPCCRAEFESNLGTTTVVIIERGKYSKEVNIDRHISMEHVSHGEFVDATLFAYKTGIENAYKAVIKGNRVEIAKVSKTPLKAWSSIEEILSGSVDAPEHVIQAAKSFLPGQEGYYLGTFQSPKHTMKLVSWNLINNGFARFVLVDPVTLTQLEKDV